MKNEHSDGFSLDENVAENMRIQSRMEVNYGPERQVSESKLKLEEILSKLEFKQKSAKQKLTIEEQEWKSRIEAILNAPNGYLSAEPLERFTKTAEAALVGLPESNIVNLEAKPVDWMEGKESNELINSIKDMQAVYRDWIEVHDYVRDRGLLSERIPDAADTKPSETWDYFEIMFMHNFNKFAPEMRSMILAMSEDYTSGETKRIETYKHMVNYYSKILEAFREDIAGRPSLLDNEFKKYYTEKDETQSN